MPRNRRRAALASAGAAGSAIALFAAVVLVPAAANAEEPFVPGSGSASAGVSRIALRSSGASIGIGLGQVRARYAGAQGNAEAAAVDLGLFDTLAKAPIACGQAPGAALPPGSLPARVAVSSGDGAAEQRTASAGAGTPVEIGSQFGSAAPNSAAHADVGGVRLDLTGVVTAIGGTATSGATLTPGKQRAATATSGLDSLVLGGGLVRLDGLRWSATNRTGAETESAGAFELAGMTIGGQQVPVSDAGSLAAALEQANTALSALGLALKAPIVTQSPDGAVVSPLRLTVAVTPALRTSLAASMEALQPIRSQLLEFLKPFGTSADCSLAKVLGFGYLIADLALAAMGESGGIDVDLGGARAGTQSSAYANPLASGFGSILPALPNGPGVPLDPAVDGAAALPGVVPAQPVPGVTDINLGQGGPGALTPVAAICRSTHSDGDGCAHRGGVAAASIALALIVLLAVADRVRARRARPG